MRETPATVDFETEPFGARPNYPPKPVGVAIREPSGKKEYWAWGHPTGNNCDQWQARQRLADTYRDGPVLFHNGSFDIDVGNCHLGLPIPKRYDDSMVTMFLHDPYAFDLGLKPLAAKYLDMPAKEQDELRDWILGNVPEARRKKTKWAEYIHLAPAPLVGVYAIGDVDRTIGLHSKFYPNIVKRGMGEAYEREIALMPTTMEMERSGVRLDVPKLKKFLPAFEALDNDVMHEIKKNLGVLTWVDAKGKPFNIGSPKQLANALVEANKLSRIVKTKKGNVSTKISVLKETCIDPRLTKLLAVHSVCSKYLSSFLRPWLEQTALTGDRILPKFNQVRGMDEGGGGARSGRYSSSDPNLQNISANVLDSKNKEILLLTQKWVSNYGIEFSGLRDLFLPDEDGIMICLDYNQQELRLLAHFMAENGDDTLQRAYIKNPDMDVHEFFRQLVHKATGKLYERKFIKIAVFGIVYGMGAGKLAGMLNVDKSVAVELRNGIYTAVPGIRKLMDRMKELAQRDEPLITWGGRQYYCEEPRYNKEDEEWMSFEYRMLNYQIQPSAADYTKAGMLNVREAVPEARIAIQVHDELVCMAPSKKYGPLIAEAMCDLKLSVPMLADAKYSSESWARAA